MPRTMLGRLACWTTLLSLAIVFATTQQAVLRADGPVKKAIAKRAHRLPKYYDQVAPTDEQRDKIRQIQDEYDPKIAALQAQLKALRKERDDKIAAVLTEDQKKKIEEAKAKAKAEAAKAKEEASKGGKPAEAAPAPSPAEPKPAK